MNVYYIIWHLLVCTVTLDSLFMYYLYYQVYMYIMGTLWKLDLICCYLLPLTAQDMVWSPRNKRPEKLKDGLKEVEVIHIYLK